MHCSSASDNRQVQNAENPENTLFSELFMPEIRRDKFEQDAAVRIRDKAVMRRLDALFNEFPEDYKCLITDIDKTNSML